MRYENEIFAVYEKSENRFFNSKFKIRVESKYPIGKRVIYAFTNEIVNEIAIINRKELKKKVISLGLEEILSLKSGLTNFHDAVKGYYNLSRKTE